MTDVERAKAMIEAWELRYGFLDLGWPQDLIDAIAAALREARRDAEERGAKYLDQIAADCDDVERVLTIEQAAEARTWRFVARRARRFAEALRATVALRAADAEEGRG